MCQPTEILLLMSGMGLKWSWTVALQFLIESKNCPDEGENMRRENFFPKHSAKSNVYHNNQLNNEVVIEVFSRLREVSDAKFLYCKKYNNQ